MTDGERLSAVETEMKNIDKQMDLMNASVQQLHGKIDSLMQVLSTNYVAKETFEEYKKGRGTERLLWIIITAIITGAVAFILRTYKI